MLLEEDVSSSSLAVTFGSGSGVTFSPYGLEIGLVQSAEDWEMIYSSDLTGRYEVPEYTRRFPMVRGRPL